MRLAAFEAREQIESGSHDRRFLRRQRNASAVLGEVEGIDLDARGLAVNTLGLRSEIAYDSLIFATGADQSYFGHPEFARDAPGMKTIDHALELRGRIFGAFEMAEAEPDPVLRRIWLTLVVVGAGPTGVELAGQIAELAHSSLHRTSAASIPQRPGSCCWTRLRRSWACFYSRCSAAPRDRWSEGASRSTWAR